MSAALVDRLIEHLRARGLRVEPGEKPGELRLAGKTSAADDAVMHALRLFKAQLLDRFGKREPRPEPTLPQSIEPGPAPPPVVAQARVTVNVCPDCNRPVDEKSRCWHCHNRPCSNCGKRTGSAFIQMCDMCGCLEDKR